MGDRCNGSASRESLFAASAPLPAAAFKPIRARPAHETERRFLTHSALSLPRRFLQESAVFEYFEDKGGSSMGQINVYGQFLTQGWDIDPGDAQGWILWGPAAENGVVAWISVKPFPGFYAGEKILEVTDFSHEADDDGSRRLFFTVRNTGVHPIIAYAMYVGWTDAI
jgi:hypothetical protein